MSGPWEKYQSQSLTEPWKKYGKSVAQGKSSMLEKATSIGPAPTGVVPTLEHMTSRLRAKAASGVGEGTGDIMASLPLGALRAATGVAEIPQGKVWEGTKDIAGGVAQAATMPAMFMAPEAGELLPSTAKAGKAFDAIEAVAGKLPIDLHGPGREALKMYERSELATSLPQVVRKFLRRTTGPESSPLTFREARMIYSEATRLSADELTRMSPPMKRQLGEFVRALGQSLESTAGRVGQSQAYRNAMRAYERAARWRDLGTTIKKKALPAAAKAAGLGAAGAAGAGAVYELGKAVSK